MIEIRRDTITTNCIALNSKARPPSSSRWQKNWTTEFEKWRNFQWRTSMKHFRFPLLSLSVHIFCKEEKTSTYWVLYPMYPLRPPFWKCDHGALMMSISPSECHAVTLALPLSNKKNPLTPKNVLFLGGPQQFISALHYASFFSFDKTRRALFYFFITLHFSVGWRKVK